MSEPDQGKPEKESGSPGDDLPSFHVGPPGLSIPDLEEIISRLKVGLRKDEGIAFVSWVGAIDRQWFGGGMVSVGTIGPGVADTRQGRVFELEFDNTSGGWKLKSEKDTDEETAAQGYVPPSPGGRARLKTGLRWRELLSVVGMLRRNTLLQAIAVSSKRQVEIVTGERLGPLMGRGQILRFSKKLFGSWKQTPVGVWIS